MASTDNIMFNGCSNAIEFIAGDRSRTTDGAFGEIYIGTSQRDTELKLALKVLHNANSSSEKLELLMDLCHDNLLVYLDYGTASMPNRTDLRPAVLTVYCEGMRASSRNEPLENWCQCTEHLMCDGFGFVRRTET